MENIELPKKGKKKNLKLILIVVFIIIPILVIGLIYYNNMTFKSKINKVLGNVPGGVSEYFKSSPTESERNDKKAFLANYYLSLDPATAADKLYIVKKDDEKLYSEIIRLMNSNSTSRTGEIIKLVRNIELRKDLLFSIHDEIQKEKQNELLDEINRLENQDLLLTINEIENRIQTDHEFKENILDIFTLMDEGKAKDILYYMDDGIREDILSSLSNDKRTSLESRLSTKKIEITKLADLANFYEVKPIEEILEEVGNSNKYSMEELGIIYKNFSILKSAEILSKIEEDSFVEELFGAIRKEEELNGEEESITNEISKSIQFITEYNKKIDDLVTVYNKMSPDKVAKIVEQMMGNNTTVTALEINSEPIFQLSDASIIIDVLSRMRNKTLSSIMDYMSTENASKLTQALARP
jgi:flagellar motility protein MotE (MotC chaperone)